MANRPLRIAIDGRELVGRPTGVGRYLIDVLRQWAVAPAEHHFVVVLPAEPAADVRALGSRFTWRIEPDSKAGTWWEQARLPRALAAERPDVLFAPGYTAPLRPTCPFVVAIYDVSFCARPEWFGWREGLRRRWLTRAAARRAHAVVTISRFSSSEIQRHFRLPSDRIVLAPPSAPPAGPTSTEPREPLVLYVGSLFNRRHLPEMIRAFATTVRAVPAARLVLVGDNRTSPRQDPMALAADAGVADRVEWREYATDADRDRLYERARVFLFLSDYEGFGMTPLEAAASGVPSVVLDTPLSREVYGDAAIRVSSDVPAIAAALQRLLADDAAHKAATEAASARLAHYSWSRSAATILHALEQAAGS